MDTFLTPRRNPSMPELLADPDFPPGGQGSRSFPSILGVLRRHRLLIAGCTAVGVVLAGIRLVRSVPLYEASTTLRLDDQQSNLPQPIETPGAGKQLPTEMEELHGRSLAEDVARQLSLQLQLTKPRGVLRSELFSDIKTSDSVIPASYSLRVQPDGKYVVIQQDSGVQVAKVTPGAPATLPGFTFTLSTKATAYSQIDFNVKSLESAAGGLTDALVVTQANRLAQIIVVTYQDADPELAWRVPSELVGRFLSRRTAVQTMQAKNTAAFLRAQLDTITGQLEAAEEKVRDYRRRNRVVSADVEANGQVNRMVQMQAERGLVEAERSALARLIDSIDTKAARRAPEEPSPYSKAVAFPTLLRSRAADELLRSLSAAQDERRALLTRRTTKDPDVKAISERIGDIEQQIREIATTYLQGLSNQVGSLDSGLGQLQRQMAGIPERELQVARLQRRPTVLGDIATLLQTRLKEAEIAAAATDGSVRVVDPAVPPDAPVSPKPLRLLLAGLVGGLLLGLGAAMAREYFDRSVHTRGDVVLASGLPILGMIPHIGRSGRKASAIAERRPTGARPRVARVTPSVAPVTPRAQAGQTGWSFLNGPSENGASEPTIGVDPAAGEQKPELDGARSATSSAQGERKSGGSRLTPVRMEMSESGSMAAEAYGVLQTNLAFARSERPLKILVLTSPMPGDGKTTTSVNLALALVRRGRNVLLVDADIRRGRVHEFFGQPRGPGLTDVLSGEVGLEQAIRPIQVGEHQMHYLGVGRPHSNPTKLLEAGGAMAALLARLGEHFETILMDSSPVNVVTDAALLSRMADGVLVIVRTGFTDSAALAHAVEQLRHVEAPVVGVVINDIDPTRDAAYDRAYEYQRHHEYVSNRV
ncbi:MAG: tyrosine-protein kinase Etk/Wzc [Gemmatimonadales bacterium]|jgi:tyrosine-protein kinase Etk/Wzc|nr:tyrosine-protein kinase Etk/Wzc [Gemmatimonadales bacterium]